MSIRQIAGKFIAGVKKSAPGRAAVAVKEKAEAKKLIAAFDRAERKEGKIRVGFIAQMPEVWNKNAPVFEAMLGDARFDPFLIAVPSFDLVKGGLKEYGEELSYFEHRCPKERILTTETLGLEFEKLPEQNFDYVIFQRCWELYLPKRLHAKSVLKHSKTVYIPYCFDLLHEPKSYYQTPFFRYSYLTFAPSKEQCVQMKAYGCPRTVYEGYPSLEASAESGSVHGKEYPLTVLWTPRWTEADHYGGTSFYDYREDVLGFVKRHPDVRLIFRPHPLLYENAVKEKKMTEEEMADLLQRYREAGILIDANADVNDTLTETDVLLTDFSSIIVNAFLYGIPILYLKDLPGSPLYEPFTSMTKLLYYPKTWAEAEKETDRLLAGEDAGKEDRKALLSAIRKEYEHSASRILDFLENDHRGTFPV